MKKQAERLKSWKEDQKADRHDDCQAEMGRERVREAIKKLWSCGKNPLFFFFLKGFPKAF